MAAKLSHLVRVLSAPACRAWMRRAVLLLLYMAAFGALSYNAQAQSPTMDEQNHMARGYALLRTGDPRLSIEHPPLINLLEALPLGRGVALPLDDTSWQTGEWYHFADLFLWHVNSLPDRMVFLSRTPVIAMTLLLGALTSRWARELGGRVAALFASAMILLDPNLLAHGSLATTDLGITITVLLSAYMLWRAATTPTLKSVTAAGLATGAMLASKMSGVGFWGAFGLVFLGSSLWSQASGPPVWRSWGFGRRLAYRALLYANITVVAFIFVWATYAFEVAPVVEGGPGVPMATYWTGLRSVFLNVQGGHTSYLLGETRLGGWPWYFPIVFAVKTPLPVFGLFVVAALVRVRPRPSRSAAFLLVPVVVYWLSALGSDLNLGYRHLLPTLPLLYVWISQRLGRCRITCIHHLGLAMLLWLLSETAMISPHFLSYFNAIGGGPERGWRIVADSNIDWGQDLKALSKALDDYGELAPLRLSWFGSSYPERYGIDNYEPLPGLPHHHNLWFEPSTFDEVQPEPGLYAISVSNLVEIPLIDKHFFTYFRQREPDARVGYSVNIYRVTGQ